MSGTIPTDEELENPVSRYGLLLCVVLYCLIISLLTSLFSSSFSDKRPLLPFFDGTKSVFSTDLLRLIKKNS
ncbi:hypothetical protein DW148_03140 [Bacteroides fragilis]|nr:hypothetical protein [Salmonella enterica subsp. enterica]RHI99779.1 hypothetical protein DW148_03140 [Bacteroides fragilis]